MNASNILGKRAVESLPDVVRVGGYNFRIEKWSHQQAASANRYGEFSSIEQTLRIQLDMPSEFKAVDTFFHEIGHAIYWVYGIHDDDKEERIVRILGVALMALHRDNPWLAKWANEAMS